LWFGSLLYGLECMTTHPGASHVQCPRLQKLFLSHNRVSNLEPLYGFNALTTLCLYHNSLLDINAALAVLQTLPKVCLCSLFLYVCTHHVL